MEDCEFTTCINCYIEMSDDDVKKNMVAGGRFYPNVVEKEDK